MTKPIRLLDDDLDDFERALLASAHADRGSELARARALGVFGAVGVSAATTSAAAASVTSPAGGVLPMSAPKVTVGLFVKWLGAGVLLGGVSASGLHTFAAASVADSGPATPAAPAVVAAAGRSPHPAVAPAAQPLVPPTPSVQPLAATVARAKGIAVVQAPAIAEASVASASNAAFPAAGADSHLREELGLLEQARQALRHRDAALSLRALAQYEARFPRGALSREAEVLGVEARLAAGDMAGARALAARALAADSHGPHARRIRSLLANEGMP